MNYTIANVHEDSSMQAPISNMLSPSPSTWTISPSDGATKCLIIGLSQEKKFH